MSIARAAGSPSLAFRVMAMEGVTELQEAVGRITGSPPESENPPELTAIALRTIAERLARLEAAHGDSS